MNDVSNLSLDLELIRDLTPEEMNGANGGRAALHGGVAHPDTPTPAVATVTITLIIAHGCSPDPEPHVEPEEE
jgi:hypothetical protein